MFERIAACLSRLNVFYIRSDLEAERILNDHRAGLTASVFGVCSRCPASLPTGRALGQLVGRAVCFPGWTSRGASSLAARASLLCFLQCISKGAGRHIDACLFRLFDDLLK